MFPKAKGTALLAALICFAPAIAVCGQNPGVTPGDCVSVRYIRDVILSPGGSEIAYVVKSPDMARNRDNYSLYIRSINDAALSQGRLIRVAEGLTAVQWLSDERIGVLETVAGVKRIVIFDAKTGRVNTLIHAGSDIESYSLDASASTLVYSAASKQANPTRESTLTAGDDASGYRISFDQEIAAAGFSKETIFVQHRTRDGGWGAAQPIEVEDPFTHRRAATLTQVQNLRLAPDGKKLLLTYRTGAIPEDWKKSFFAASVAASNPLMPIIVMYDLTTRQTSLAIKTVFPDSAPAWDSNSRRFFLSAHSPIGSLWESEDIRDHQASGADANLFAVDATSLNVEQVVRHVSYHHEGPLFLTRDGDVIVHTGWTTIGRFHNEAGQWRESSRISLPHGEADRFTLIASNGSGIVGVHEAVSTPENLFAYEPEQSSIRILTDLNPQLDKVHFAPVKTIQWKIENGMTASGLLFMPPDYRPGTRYPLVIQTKGSQGWFTCDSGGSHEPSFAAQPIASAGIMYLIRTVGEEWKFQDEIDSYPKGYPGGIAEAVHQMNVWDSAVEELDQQGLIDPKKVGIIGFSRTGWQVEYDLVHAHTKYVAATATDNVQYSLSEYWLNPAGSASEEHMYGGPPYGASYDNWKKYSISFNLDKIHTPLLMEVMGYGLPNKTLYALPINLAIRYEVSNGLTRLGKAVEVYYYPNEGHQPEHPLARLASIQRNVDWYRFWLQGYERHHAEDDDHYKRWERLRNLQSVDLKSAHMQ